MKEIHPDPDFPDLDNPQPIPFQGGADAANDFFQDAHSNAAKPFPLWTPPMFRAYQPSAERDILGTAILRRGQLALLMGQPGLGKSTLATALAVANIRGDGSIAGIPLMRTPRRWLFAGNENGKDRWKDDLGSAEHTIGSARREAWDTCLQVAGVFDEDAADLTLPACEDRLRQTILEARPDVIVLDPWTELVANEIDSAMVRETLGSLRRVVRQASPESAILVICHAKAGKNNAAECAGRFGNVNAQRGNRMLTSSARSALLLYPHDDAGEDLVLLLNKCNDGPPLKPRRIQFVRKEWRYSVDEGFDFEAWRTNLHATRKAGPVCTTENVVEVVRQGHRTTAEITKALESKAGERTVKKTLATACKDGHLQKLRHGQYVLGPVYNQSA